MPDPQKYEKQFFAALRDIFVGAKVEGDSGFVNLMRIKSRYYEQGVFPQLKKDIGAALEPFPGFREELFDKLYTFFRRYFSESGSIYFRYTALHQNVYEKVYTDDRDVMLFWKTHMLYYVKTDRIFNSLSVEVDGLKFFFDAGEMASKRANEKREVVFEFREINPDGTLVFDVSYSEKGRRTKLDDILKAVKQSAGERDSSPKLGDEILDQAFRVFEKQSEVDFFINKNARAFLQEQFELWMYQYLFAGLNIWDAGRLAELQALKGIAFKVIDFISQFEDELVKIWNKPKFARSSHYIITLDKLSTHSVRAGSTLLEKILAHPGMVDQLQEWRDLGMLEQGFSLEMLTLKDLLGEPLHPRYRYLPLDTKHFKDLEPEILALFDDPSTGSGQGLDGALDGWLVRSENYQALNTLLPKFREKVQAIYIDPPYNTGEDEFVYRDKFQYSSWLTMMDNRLRQGKDFLSRNGVFLTSIGREEVFELELLLDREFGPENQVGDLVWEKGRKNDAKYFSLGHDYLLVYARDEKYLNSMNTVWREEKPGAREILNEY